MSTAGRDYLGPYRLVRLLRASQNAQIWEAINQSENKRYAIKALQDQHCSNAAQVAALKAEFEVANVIDHPQVIHQYKYGVDRNIPYVVMEFFTSVNLKQMMRDKPEILPPLVPSIIQQMGAGLGGMHDAGWIHRDVKPDNFLVDEKGTTKLIDFSIAQPRYSGFSAFFAGFTKSAAIQGTRSYMAPEQIRNEVVDIVADMYSFGCTLYELLAKKVPYTGTNSEDLLNKHLRAQVPLVSAANNQVTPEMTNLIQRMMAKNKEQRPQTMKDFLDEFKHIKVYKAPK